MALHRDLSIAVKDKVDSAQWSAWSEKGGVLFVQPPRKVLESLVVLRLHLEENAELNGPLQVVPMTHQALDQGVSLKSRKQVEVFRGGALLMKTLLLHASTKVVCGQRRVLHFVLGPMNYLAKFNGSGLFEVRLVSCDWLFLARVKKIEYY